MLPYFYQDEKASEDETKEEKSSFVRTEAAGNKIPKVIVDSGTTYYTAEKPVFDAITSRIPEGSCKDVNDATYPSITYVLKDSEGTLYDLMIPPHMYMVSDETGHRC